MFIVLLIASSIGGFLSGLLGIGGAVVLIPLFYSIPPLVGAGQLSMHEVAGISMVQVLVASLSGCLAHGRCGNINWNIILATGLPMGAFAFAGSAWSKCMSEATMLIVFGCLTIMAFFMLLRKAPDECAEYSGHFDFHLAGSIIVGSAVGLASGIIGAGGGFILIPIMVRILKLPMKIAVGSSLGIVFIGALMGSLGKAITLQIEWIYLIPVIAASIPAALLGSRISKQAPPRYLRYLLIGVLFVVNLNTWKDILF